MSLECSECERDLRGGHDPSCSRYRKPCEDCRTTWVNDWAKRSRVRVVEEFEAQCDEECNCDCHKVKRR